MYAMSIVTVAAILFAAAIATPVPTPLGDNVKVRSQYQKTNLAPKIQCENQVCQLSNRAAQARCVSDCQKLPEVLPSLKRSPITLCYDRDCSAYFDVVAKAICQSQLC
ncbi:hypothetical protein BX600DRAFT_442964 [Xylariales sp. PMI_506]|nr:hypothetical protein BX600DRAFT_442964 [Xylariales sp. PMI_506]